MAEVTYLAIVEPAKDGCGISFPDVPGCVSFAEFSAAPKTGWEYLAQTQAIQAAATEALRFHLDGMMEDGEPLPRASGLHTVDRRDESPGAQAMPVVVELPEARPARAIRANLTFDERLLERIDKAAEQQGETRSGWLAEAAREKMGRTDPVSGFAEPGRKFRPKV